MDIFRQARRKSINRMKNKYSKELQRLDMEKLKQLEKELSDLRDFFRTLPRSKGVFPNAVTRIIWDIDDVLLKIELLLFMKK